MGKWRTLVFGIMFMFLIIGNVSAGWWDTDYDGRKQINITGGTSNLVNFTVLMNISYDSDTGILYFNVTEWSDYQAAEQTTINFTGPTDPNATVLTTRNWTYINTTVTNLSAGIDTFIINWNGKCYYEYKFKYFICLERIFTRKKSFMLNYYYKKKIINMILKRG